MDYDVCYVYFGGNNMNLIDVILKHDTVAVQKLLEQGADPNFSEDEAGLTALHFAAQEGDYEIAKLLMTFGADPFRFDKAHEMTPFDVAILHQHIDLIALFNGNIFK
jgi:ankyrin repeat protein